MRLGMVSAVVVGAGQSGLRAAAELAGRGLDVALFERLPACGGQEPERPLADELTAAALRRAVAVRLGTCAIAWDGRALTTLGLDGRSQVDAGALVVATGCRPATRGELGIAGDRCAGVIPVSAAIHLLESGVLVGRRPAVVGDGEQARRVTELLLQSGAVAVTVVAPGAGDGMPAEADLYLGWKAEDVRGTARVESVTIARDGVRERVVADALILASGRIPARNIEGAVFGGPNVVYCQPTDDPKSTDGSVQAALSAAAETETAVSSAAGNEH
jgi:NADPH-dependent 2,4-dienoyl-CoA reductase/sulfur reductase-like enzyme